MTDINNNNSINTFQIEDTQASSNTITFIKEKTRIGNINDNSRVHVDLTLAKHID